MYKSQKLFLRFTNFLLLILYEENYMKIIYIMDYSLLVLTMGERQYDSL